MTYINLDGAIVYLDLVTILLTSHIHVSLESFNLTLVSQSSATLTNYCCFLRLLSLCLWFRYLFLCLLITILLSAVSMVGIIIVTSALQLLKLILSDEISLELHVGVIQPALIQ